MKHGPFPPEPPTALTDADAIRSNDWSAFSALTHMEDHFTVKPWPGGFSAYYWYLTFEDVELISSARQCQQSLSSFGLHPVSLSSLHMTLCRVGAADSISDAAIEVVTSSAAEALERVDSFEIEVGPLAGSSGAVRFSVTPWSSIWQLATILRSLPVNAAAGTASKPLSDFRPHIGIAYSNRRQEIAPILERVSQLRDIVPVPIAVTQVKLVRLWRSQDSYEWDDVATIALR
ncbi:2'-5' RNA ligase family protein [Nocardia sp. NPDC056541]|uniref:2'-5' RNA ligase family protein n=1 Tax=Nocardia sp. NPDC056541 TaxID=3345860 RepID=UPI00366F4CF9